MKPMITLTQEQIDFFHREGYLAIPAITTQEEVARLRVIYDRLFARNAGRDEGNQFDLAGTDEEGKEQSLPQLLNASKYAPELLTFQIRSNALAIAHQLIGDDAKPQIDHAILKPGPSGAATAWHQDEAYWGAEYDYNTISIWVPLQEATLENGCMQFIPHSHRLEVLPHHSINNDPRIIGLEVDDGQMDVRQAVPCPLPPGGATIHPGRTFHYTSPNRTTQPRRAYIMTFGSAPKPRATPRDFYWMRGRTPAREERARQAAARGIDTGKIIPT